MIRVNTLRRVKRSRQGVAIRFYDAAIGCQSFTIGDLLTYQTKSTAETTRKLREELPKRWRLCQSTLSALPHGLNTLPTLTNIAVEYEKRATTLEQA